MARAHPGPAGQVVDGQRPVEPFEHPGEEGDQRVVVLGGDGGGDELGLAAGPQGRHDQPPGDGVGNDRAEAAGTVVLPAMAFFGGLGDLLASAAMGDWAAAEEAHIAYGLSGWHPTDGTRASGAVSRERRDGRRVRYTGGRLEYRRDAPPVLDWSFPDPMGLRPVIGEFTMADVITIPSHLAIPEVCTYMTTEAAGELAAPDTPAPTAVDEQGRSAQTFLVDVRLRSGGAERRAVARGRDIYAVSAPLVVEALHRILTGRTKAVGVVSAGALFDAPDFLRSLAPELSVELPQ